MYCLTAHILVEAGMYDSAKSVLRHLCQMGIGSKFIFGALMDTYPLCSSIPSIFDLLIRVYLKEGMVEHARETFELVGLVGFKPSLYIYIYRYDVFQEFNRHNLKLGAIESSINHSLFGLF